MSNKKTIFETEDVMSTSEIAGFLRNFANKLESGEITLEKGEKKAHIVFPSKLEMELEVEEKKKGDRVKKEIEIELEWYEGEDQGKPLEVK